MSLSSWAIREAKACHSIANSTQAVLVALSVASCESFSQVKALSRYFSDAFKWLSARR